MLAENEINFLYIFQMIPEHILVIETVYFLSITYLVFPVQKKKDSSSLITINAINNSSVSWQLHGLSSFVLPLTPSRRISAQQFVFTALLFSFLSHKNDNKLVWLPVGGFPLGFSQFCSISVCLHSVC